MSWLDVDFLVPVLDLIDSSRVSHAKRVSLEAVVFSVWWEL